MIITCSSCFKAISYESVRPIHCQFCGKPVNAAFEVKIDSKNQVVASKQESYNDIERVKKLGKGLRKKVIYVDDNDNETEGPDEDGNYSDGNFDIPAIGQLDVNITVAKRESLGQLIANPDGSMLGQRGTNELTKIPE